MKEGSVAVPGAAPRDPAASFGGSCAHSAPSQPVSFAVDLARAAQLRTHVDVADMWHEDETGALADACAALAQLQELSAKVNHALRRHWPTPALGAHL